MLVRLCSLQKQKTANRALLLSDNRWPKNGKNVKGHPGAAGKQIMRRLIDAVQIRAFLFNMQNIRRYRASCAPPARLSDSRGKSELCSRNKRLFTKANHSFGNRRTGFCGKRVAWQKRGESARIAMRPRRKSIIGTTGSAFMPMGALRRGNPKTDSASVMPVIGVM